jgi:hypothetical protein
MLMTSVYAQLSTMMDKHNNGTQAGKLVESSQLP